MFKGWLHQHLSEKTTRIIAFNLNTEAVKLLKNVGNAVIIADKKYIPLLKKVCATTDNSIFELAVYTKEYRLQNICEAIETQRPSPGRGRHLIHGRAGRGRGCVSAA